MRGFGQPHILGVVSAGPKESKENQEKRIVFYFYFLYLYSRNQS